MLRVKIQLSDIKKTSKPRNAGFITQEIEGKIQTVTIREFAEAVGQDGRTFTPAIFNGARKIDNFVSQQVYVLDFDDGFTIAEFKERANKYKMEYAIIYEKFSSTKEQEKFRVVFINDIEICDKQAAAIMNKMLLHIFPEADKQCKDVARMFYGGKRVVDINENPRPIDLVDISTSLHAFKKDTYGKNLSREMERSADDLEMTYKKMSMLYQYDLRNIEQLIINGISQII